MSYWFWIFLIYSFLGYCLEKLYARSVHSPRRVRKCFLILPLCPVYGIAMAAVAALIAPDMPLLRQAVLCGAVCTAVEYLVHLFYDRMFDTKFWDYSAMRFHVSGRVTPQFSIIWGILSAAALRFLHPSISAAAADISAPLTFALWITLAADSVMTAALLLRHHDAELLSLSALLSQQ